MKRKRRRRRCSTLTFFRNPLATFLGAFQKHMLAVLVLSVASVGWTSPWMNTRDTPEVRAHKLVAEMTTTEKVRLFNEYFTTRPHTNTHTLSTRAFIV